VSLGKHRPGCSFGPGFYRIEFISGSRRYCQDEQEVRRAYALLITDTVRRVSRDGYCLDPLEVEAERGVVEGERFLNLPRDEGMRQLGIDSEADYVKAYRAVEDAVLANDRVGGQASVVIKKKGQRVLDV